MSTIMKDHQILVVLDQQGIPYASFYDDKKEKVCTHLVSGKLEKLHKAIRPYHPTLKAEYLRKLVERKADAAVRAKDKRTVGNRWIRKGNTVYANDLLDGKILKINKNKVTRPKSTKVFFQDLVGNTPMPRYAENGANLQLLKKYSPFQERGQNVLFLTWLVHACMPCYECPILLLSGPQGAGKSTMARLLSKLIDPTRIPVVGAPRTEKDLALLCQNKYLQIFDNVGQITSPMQDCLCRMVTGGGQSERALFTNTDIVITDFRSPIIFNALENPFSNADLLERVVQINFQRLEPEQYDRFSGQRDLEDSMVEDIPAIYSGMVDLISKVLGIREQLDIKSKPRMSDFYITGHAVEKALNAPKGSFVRAFRMSQSHSDYDILDNCGLDLDKSILKSLCRKEPWYSSQLVNRIKCNVDSREVTKILRRIDTSIERIHHVKVDFLDRRGGGVPITFTKLSKD